MQVNTQSCIGLGSSDLNEVDFIEEVECWMDSDSEKDDDLAITDDALSQEFIRVDEFDQRLIDARMKFL